ncbi:GyrI-like domain-containing protein [Humitalea sp. 24SJ18S-53]|uniref:GyrI-like domain-containing protein n=1 Tax=Humitalea sp. 24SJ18S-53 TaxID=3422307 RepID=UPI003D66EF12
MIDTPHLADAAGMQTAAIHLTIPRDKMPEVFGPAVGEILATLAAQGIDPAGPFFAHHFSMTPGVFDFALGVPVETPVRPEGRVAPGELPAMRVARTVHYGPYEGLPASWGAFDAWIAAQGLSTRQNLIERYVVHPNADPDPAAWRTELNRPLA